jgi:hypothetical protein
VACFIKRNCVWLCHSLKVCYQVIGLGIP